MQLKNIHRNWCTSSDKLKTWMENMAFQIHRCNLNVTVIKYLGGKFINQTVPDRLQLVDNTVNIFTEVNVFQKQKNLR